jgi:hypothetical protein
MHLTEEQNRKKLPMGWSTEEEFVIATVQQTESAPHSEVIRRMQRRKKMSGIPTDRTLWRRRAILAARPCVGIHDVTGAMIKTPDRSPI